MLNYARSWFDWEWKSAKSSQGISVSDGDPWCLRLLDSELDKTKQKEDKILDIDQEFLTLKCFLKIAANNLIF